MYHNKVKTQMKMGGCLQSGQEGAAVTIQGANGADLQPHSATLPHCHTTILPHLPSTIKEADRPVAQCREKREQRGVHSSHLPHSCLTSISLPTSLSSFLTSLPSYLTSSFIPASTGGEVSLTSPSRLAAPLH